jgi:hypothetical protein
MSRTGKVTILGPLLEHLFSCLEQFACINAFSDLAQIGYNKCKGRGGTLEGLVPDDTHNITQGDEDFVSDFSSRNAASAKGLVDAG